MQTLRYQTTLNRINETIWYMKEHGIICKFIDIWPIKKDLIWWINTKWKPLGNYDIKVGAKGFFNIIFTSMEDNNTIFNNGFHLFNFVGLDIKFWVL